MNRQASLIVLLIIAMFAISIAIQPILPVTSERYSEFGILGPGQQIVDYPTSVTVGQSFLLYGYVANHEGVTTYYKILIKLGDEGTQVSKTVYANSTAIQTYAQVLLNNQSWTFPLNLTIDTPGLHLKLIFELWKYNTTSSSFGYTGLFNTLYLNVTNS